jgi:phospholipid/cholesterol/gamma-HCH transport system ATP-binding protein
MIELRAVHKRLGGRTVLNGVDLKVEAGASLAVVGGSGTGKSVLLKHVIGLLEPDAGDVIVAGRSLAHAHYRELASIRAGMAFVFQDCALLDSLTVFENLCLALDDVAQCRERVRARRLVEATLAAVNLDERVLGQLPGELSGGMRKRVAVARAIIKEPRIILYDEPTTGLDPIMADVINGLIIRLRESLGVTSISITHDMSSAYKIADTIAMLYKGKIIEVGTPDRIRHSANPVVSQFVEGRAQGPITAELEEFKRFVHRSDESRGQEGH